MGKKKKKVTEAAGRLGLFVMDGWMEFGLFGLPSFCFVLTLAARARYVDFRRPAGGWGPRAGTRAVGTRLPRLVLVRDTYVGYDMAIWIWFVT